MALHQSDIGLNQTDIGFNQSDIVFQRFCSGSLLRGEYIPKSSKSGTSFRKTGTSFEDLPTGYFGGVGWCAHTNQSVLQH
jgi:hypothetical protein